MSDVVVSRHDGANRPPAIRAIRLEVFAREQGIEQEFHYDPEDKDATHYLARVDGAAAGTARLLITRLTRDVPTGIIQRVATLPDYRGQGVAGALMRTVVDDLRADPEVVNAELSAQEDAIAMYAHLGFIAEGDMYMDVGIPHLKMVMDVSS